ncbi:MAG: HAD family hydrolase [Dokdonella sp.]
MTERVVNSVAVRDDIVILIDVDNTLLDNDRFADDLRARLTCDFGVAECERYWSIYAELRDRLGYADYLGALQAFRVGSDNESSLLRMSEFLLEYPFAERLYPDALTAIEHLGTIGTTAILSDGDIVFQPRKIQRSGLWEAVAGRVLIYLHKEKRLDAIQRSFPANHYVMIDDKPTLLAAAKKILGERLTSVFVRQGHYANAPGAQDCEPPPDITIEKIGDLLNLTITNFQANARSQVPMDRHFDCAAVHTEQS